MMPIQYKRWISKRSIVPPSNKKQRTDRACKRENIRSNGFLEDMGNYNKKKKNIKKKGSNDHQKRGVVYVFGLSLIFF